MSSEFPAALARGTSLGRVTQISGQVAEVLVDGLPVEELEKASVGTYVAIPTDHRRVVGLISAAQSLNPAAEALSEVKVTVQLLGQIEDGRFSRGVERYPMVGDRVEAVCDDDLDAIFTNGLEHEASTHFIVGKFAVNDRYPVYLSGKHFFSKHAAVLGNSGAGKSCAITRIISESIKYEDSQVILFDLHGEYAEAFRDPAGQMLENVTYINENDLVLPYWLLSYDELAALFVDQSNPMLISNQRSLLREGVTKLKYPAAKKLGLEKTYNVDTPVYFSLNRLKLYAENLNDSRFVLNTNRYAFARTALRNLEESEQEKVLLSQRVKFNQGQPEGEIAHPLYHQKLNGFVDRVEHRLNDHRYDFLLRPIKHAEQSPNFYRWIPEAKKADELDWSAALGWIVRIMTGQLQPRRNLTIVDLSGIPSDIIDLTVGLLTRIVFDYNFYSPSRVRKPVALVYEEAHNYVPRENHRHSFARLGVERVAKEGRKYGVSCIVVSQRPSELSHTVLSQCNNMIVMRLSNPEDQNYVIRVVSDQFAELVKLLPTLRQGEAFVIGDSVAMPLRTLVQLPDAKPRSQDIDFFHRWSNYFQGADIDEVINRWWRQQRPC